MSEIDDISSDTFAGLTGFQRDILVILAADKVYKGLGVKDELEGYYDEEVNHGRLYPNLDSLEEKGLISKVKIDDRTNGYDITPTGELHLKQRLNWERSIGDREEVSGENEDTTEPKSVTDGTQHESESEGSSPQAVATEENDRTARVDEGVETQHDPEALIDEILKIGRAHV